MELRQKLLIRFGLDSQPSPEQIKQWAERTVSFRALGLSIADAGNAAAQAIFPDYRTRVYASEADSIEALLAAALERAQRG